MTEATISASDLRTLPSNPSQIITANELGESPDDAEELEAGANRCAVS